MWFLETSTRFLKGKASKNESNFPNFSPPVVEVLNYDVFLHLNRRRRKFWGFEPFKMRVLKGKSLTKELIFQIFRAAGAPIWGFSGHNPKSGL